jgi:hypothetical protein
LFFRGSPTFVLVPLSRLQRWRRSGGYAKIGFGYREIYRENLDFASGAARVQLNSSMIQEFAAQFPAGCEQGIFRGKQGISNAEQGNFFAG